MVVGFIWVRVGSIGRTNRSSRVAWVYSGATSGLHSGSRGFNRARLVVVGFIRVRVVSYRCLWYVSFEFAWIHSCASKFRRIHSRSCGFSGAPIGGRVHWDSLGFTQASLVVAGFIQFRVASLRR